MGGSKKKMGFVVCVYPLISSILGMLDLADHMSAANKDAYINQLKNELSRTVLCCIYICAFYTRY